MTSKAEVLRLFKLLHKTKNRVFQGDTELINVMRKEINDQFRQNKSEKDLEKIKELIKDGFLAEEELRTRIIQAEKIKPGYHRLNVTEDHCITDWKPRKIKKK